MLQATRYAVGPVRPCKTDIFEIYSPLVPLFFPSFFGACGINHRILHQNEFSENIFLVNTFCCAYVYDTIPGGYMKGVKAEKLKSAKSTSKVFFVPLQPLQPLATFCYSVFAPITRFLSCKLPTSYYNRTGEKDPCETYRWEQR